MKKWIHAIYSENRGVEFTTEQAFPMTSQKKEKLMNTHVGQLGLLM